VNYEIPSQNSFSSSFEKGFFDTNETYIHPTSIVGPNVTLHDNVKIGPYCTIIGNTTIGPNSRIYGNTTIGFPAQDTTTTQSLGTLEIGQNCHIREFVTIHASKENNGLTKISNNCYIMNFVHIAHDVVLEDNVILVNQVNLGGHSHVEQGVMLMANTAMHQFCRIGKMSSITPFSATRQDLPPFCLFTGQPVRFSGLNLIALKRAGSSRQRINSIKHVTKLFYQDKLPFDEIKKLSVKESDEWGNDPCVIEFLSFVENSNRGISRRCLSYGSTLYYE
jgi:UDP-N-acetylglucosamine acyltransferase